MDEMASCLEFALKIILVVTACWGYELVSVETMSVTEKMLLFCLFSNLSNWAGAEGGTGRAQRNFRAMKIPRVML